MIAFKLTLYLQECLTCNNIHQHLISMKSQTITKFTPLLPLIIETIKTISRRAELTDFVSDQQLTLAIIEKSPILVVSDFAHSIQAAKPKSNTQSVETVHPWSRFKNSFYCVIDRSWIHLNAKMQDIGDPSQFPHPYQPYFYFRSNYDEYRRDRSTVRYMLDCQVIDVRRWSLKIVNISGTGYYGVILDLLNSRYPGQRFVENTSNITSIIYEKEVKQKMELLRLQDLRELHLNSEDKKVPWSLFYYCRNTNLNPNSKKRLNNIIKVDNKQALLAFNEDRKSSFVNFGEMEGVNCLQYPINRKDIDYQLIKRINLKELELLFNAVQPMVEAREERQYQEGELWSSDDQESSSKLPQKKEKRKDTNQEQQESSSSDSGQDLLKNLYLKQFQNMRIV